MFSDKEQKTKRRVTLLGAGVVTLALAVTFSYATMANAQIQASISKPALRTEYKNTNSINLDSVVSLNNGDRKISVSLRDSDLRQTLRMIADKAGLNIIFHNSVSGNVTLDLVNVTLNDAFKMIMQASDLSYLIDNDTLIVMSKDASLKSDIGKQNMMTIPVKYADSAKVADFLNSNIFATNRPGLSNNKIVVTNPVNNELIIFGTKNDYLMAQKIVNKIDVQPKTISYRVNHTTPKEMATLICQSLFPTATVGGVGADGGSTDAGAGASQDGAAGKMSGSLLGGAASLGGSSSGGSPGGMGGGMSTSSSSGDADSISLGEGTVACSLNGSVKANELTSLTGSALTVTYFPQKGTINITGGSEAQAEMVKDFIQANDKKQPQAFVEMQIVELSEDGSKTFQNNWSLYSRFFTGTFGGGGVATDGYHPMIVSGSGLRLADPLSDEPDKVHTLIERHHGKSSLSWHVNYLVKNGKGRLLANPKVMVTNGKKSVINLSSDYIKSVDEEIMTAAGGTGVAGISRDYEIGQDCGIIVEMTPFISPDGYVTMNLKPSYAQEKPNGKHMSISATGDEILAATLLQRRNLELSNIRIKDGETLVIGGLIQETETKTVAKTPILGDLPVIGSLFRSTSTSNEKSELVIMVTPRIIKDTEDVASDNTENL